MLLTVVLAAVATAAVGRDETGSAPPDRRYIHAAHWFGDAWPVNFWNTDLESRAREHFDLLLQDGFNTVVFLVPWPGFAPDPTSGALDAERVRRLRELMLLADEMGLGSIVRISYAWDWIDRGSGQRLRRLWIDDDHYRGWLDYIEALWSAIGDVPGLRFGFFSWEDLWAVTWFETEDEARRRAAARESGFVAWLQERHGIEAVRERFGDGVAQWQDVAIPERRDPAYGLFVEFISEAWVRRFFEPAQQRFPKLSMEVRIDSDPVYDGERLVEWFDHGASWDLPGAEWVTIYWSPAMGGDNRGEALSADTGAERLAWWLDRVAERVGPKPIFVGQFLFQDFTPGFEMNGRIPDRQLPEFLDRAADALAGRSGGVGLWTWADYAHDGIANPEFFAGLAGWDADERASLEAGAVRLPGDGWLATDLARFAYSIPDRPDVARLCVRARGLDGGARLRAFEDGAAEPVAVLEFDGRWQRHCVDHALAARRLRLESDAAIAVDRVNSTGFVQRSGIRDRDFAPKATHDAYRRLTATLQRRPALRQPRFADGWMGRLLVEPLEAAESAAVLRLQTYLPPHWPEPPMLRVAVDGQMIGRVECGDARVHELPLPRKLSPGDVAMVRIEASSVHREPGDVRPLGCNIAELGLSGGASADGSSLQPTRSTDGLER